MSWSFTGAGKPADVRHHIQSLDSYGDELGPASQQNLARALVSAELDAWPEDGWSNAVIVEASGHHDGNGRALSISIRGIRLAEPAPAAALAGALADDPF